MNLATPPYFIVNYLYLLINGVEIYDVIIYCDAYMFVTGFN